MDKNGFGESTEMLTLREKLQLDTNNILRGFSDNDVEWFLRGTIVPKKSADDIKPIPSAPKHEPPVKHEPPKVLPSVGNTTQVTAHAEPLRRARSHSVSSGLGFFGKLSQRFRRKDKPAASKSALATLHATAASTELTRVRSSLTTDSLLPLERLRSSPVGPQDLDPRFQKFLEFYKNRDHDQLSLKARDLVKDQAKDQVKEPPKNLFADPPPRSPTVDTLGRPLPALPAVAPLPSALKNREPLSDASSALLPRSLGILGLLKRHPDHSAGLDSLNLSFENPKEIPGFMKMPPLKRVTFSEKVFFNDPPQQIASRNPKKGEVEILENGNIVIHKITPEERQARGGGGVVVGGYRHTVGLDTHNNEQHTSKSNGQADASPEKSTEGPAKRTESPEKNKESSGKRSENSKPKNDYNLGEESDSKAEENESSAKARSIAIDKPMVTRNKSSASITSGDETLLEELMSRKVPLDVLYTRCCHLREILPIKLTMKQIPKGLTSTLPQLQFKNSLPLLIEIVTFGDFISIAPITLVVLDGILLSYEMFRILIASLVYKTDLKRLSLRNTCLDAQGWKLLCWFLVRNQSLESLDITQCSSLVVLPARSSKKSAAVANIVRMESNKDNRLDMDWSMFVAALIMRGGIEALVLTGCKINNMPAYQKLFELGLSKTRKIGLAYNDLTPEQVSITCDWVFKYCEHIQAVDLGYNSLKKMSEVTHKSSFHYLVEVITRINKEKRVSALRYLLMSLTEILQELSTTDLVETLSFVYSLLRLPNLQFLDFSGNPRYFKGNIEMLCSILAQFKRLLRLHLEYNGLDDVALTVLCDALLSCKKIYYLSLVGNNFGIDGYNALINLLRKTSVISLGLDYEKVPEKIRAKIGTLTMQNMEKVISSQKFKLGDDEEEPSSEEEDDTIGIQGEDHYSLGSLNESMVTYIQSCDSKLEHGEMLDNEEVDRTVNHFLNKVYQIKINLGDIIQRLVKLRLKHKLNNDGKETLIRFCFIDSSLDRMLTVLQERFPQQYSTFLSQHPLAASLPEVAHEKCLVLARADKGTQPGSPTLEEPEEFESSGSAYHPVKPELVRQPSSSSVQSLRKLDQEEGTIMRATSKLKEVGKNKDLKAITSKTEQFDGQKIKGVLLNTSKLGKIITVIDSIKENNISIDDVFQESDEGDSSEDSEDSEGEGVGENKIYNTLVDQLVRVRSTSDQTASMNVKDKMKNGDNNVPAIEEKTEGP